MVNARASDKLKLRPWSGQKSVLAYWARSNPLFFFPAMLFIVSTPVFAGYQYYLKVTNNDQYVNQFKCNYTVYRAEDYPKELHKFCRT